MTSSKVSQLAALMRNSELTGTRKTSQQGNDPVFGALLSQTAGGNQQNLSPWKGNAIQPPRAELSNQTAFVKETAAAGYRDNSVKGNTSDIQSKLPGDAQEKLSAFEEKATKTVAEELGVTEEEVREAMEALGMTAFDLSDPAQLAALTMKLTGMEDPGALLLDENFQQLMGDMEELFQKLPVQLNLTPEDMAQLMEQMEAMENVSPEEELTVQMPESEAAEPDGDLTGTVPEQSEQNADVIRTISQEAAQEQKVQNPDGKEQAGNEPAADSRTTEETGAVTAQTQEESGEGNAEKSPEKSLSEMTQDTKEPGKEEAGRSHITYQTTTQTVNQGQTVEVTQTVVQTRINVEDIMRQVSQMTRVMVSQAESSIEMQLNPANLGKVYLQVVSREGVITAQLAAQNEAVREALESQVAVLKENMNQQGIKVEAIEVTIASHEFERNLEQNQQSPAQEQQEENARKSSRRNINLNSLEDLEGAMTEEEDLVAKIMTDQGNSVDLTA